MGFFSFFSFSNHPMQYFQIPHFCNLPLKWVSWGITFLSAILHKSALPLISFFSSSCFAQMRELAGNFYQVPLVFEHQAPVVQTLDSAILWINHYPLDNSIGFASVYPLDSNLSGGQRYLSFEQLGPGK